MRSQSGANQPRVGPSRIGRARPGSKHHVLTDARDTESVIAWLHGPRRLRTRWRVRDDMHDAFLQLAPCMTLARKHPAL